MKTYNTDYALHDFLEEVFTKYGGFQENTVFILSLGEESSFYSVKDFVLKTYGPDALDKKPGTYRYFILFKMMDKDEIIKKLNRLYMFGEVWNDEDIVEYDRNGVVYYMTRIAFED